MAYILSIRVRMETTATTATQQEGVINVSQTKNATSAEKGFSRTKICVLLVIPTVRIALLWVQIALSAIRHYTFRTQDAEIARRSSLTAKPAKPVNRWVALFVKEITHKLTRFVFCVNLWYQTVLPVVLTSMVGHFAQNVVPHSFHQNLDSNARSALHS